MSKSPRAEEKASAGSSHLAGAAPVRDSTYTMARSTQKKTK